MPADDRDLAGLLLPAVMPSWSRRPASWWRAAAAVRQALRDSVAHRPADQRALVPALVDGDDAGVDEGLQEDFRATGLTHLLAVSGTNLTLVVGFLLALARWCRVRGRWLHVVAGLGIVGFVLIARTEPSVLRAAVMGTIGLVALGADGRHRALRGLGTAVLVLVLLDPGLAVSAGFALSVLATGGILLLAPAWRDALARWLPRWLAEAIAVPAAAQLACTPLVAAISGQVSLVAVVANLLVAPVVGPATVLGLAGGLLTLVWAPLGRLCGTAASWCVAWLVAVAEHGAALPTASVPWGTGPAALVVLTAVTALVALAGPRLLRRPVTAVGVAVVLVAAVLVRPPAFGWPPDGWVLVACDVGQGDALVLHAGQGTAVVVDAGPEPRAVDRCLDRLGVGKYRCWCSPTSTPTTWTGSPACSRVERSTPCRPPGCSIRPAGSAEVDDDRPGSRAGARSGDVRRDDCGRRGHGPGALAATGLTDPRTRRRVDRQRGERRAAGRGRRAPAAAHR